MTVCLVAPSTTMTILIFIAAILVPSVIIFFLWKKRVPENKFWRALISIAAFIILFLVILIPLYSFFTLPCAGGSYCMPVEFYPENKTCFYGHRLVNDSDYCNRVYQEYNSQVEAGDPCAKSGGMTFYY